MTRTITIINYYNYHCDNLLNNRQIIKPMNRYNRLPSLFYHFPHKICIKYVKLQRHKINL